MNSASIFPALVPAIVSLLLTLPAFGGTWNDHFSQPTLAEDWTGNRNAFRIQGGILEGQSVSPVAVSPLNVVELAQDSTELDVACWMNVVAPNVHVCTKGALILRHSGNEGYVFALHEATQTIELYRLSNHEMLLIRPAKIELKKWYYVRAELRGPAMNFYVDGQWIGMVNDDRSASGSVGVAVQDAEAVRFDDFSISGPQVKGNVDDVSLPELRVTVNGSNQVVLRFLAAPPYDYFVQASSSAFSHEWETIGTFTAKLEYFDAEISDPLTNGMRFYRVEKVHCGCR